MVVYLSPVLNEQQFDSNGNVLAGGMVNVYIANTVSPQPAYKDITGLTAWSNPILLDANGYLPGGNQLWLPQSSVSDILVSNVYGVPVHTYHSVSGINDVSNEQVITFWTPFTAAYNYITHDQFSVDQSQGALFAVNNRLQFLLDGVWCAATITAVNTSMNPTIVTVFFDANVILTADNIGGLQLSMVPAINNPVPSDIVSGGDINLTEGNINLTEGNINLTEGNINLTEGNITLNTGHIDAPYVTLANIDINDADANGYKAVNVNSLQGLMSLDIYNNNLNYDPTKVTTNYVIMPNGLVFMWASGVLNAGTSTTSGYCWKTFTLPIAVKHVLWCSSSEEAVLSNVTWYEHLTYPCFGNGLSPSIQPTIAGASVSPITAVTSIWFNFNTSVSFFVVGFVDL
jgi:hypothetical protein